MYVLDEKILLEVACLLSIKFYGAKSSFYVYMSILYKI